MLQNYSADLDVDELLYLAVEATQNNRHRESIQLLKQMLTLEPDHAKGLYLLGALHAQVGLYDRAILEIDQAVALEPELWSAHFQLGFLHMHAGRVEQAQQTWQALEPLGEAHYLAHFTRGLLALSANRFEEALAALRTGMAHNLENAAMNKDIENLILETENRRLGLATGTVAEKTPAAIPQDTTLHRTLLAAYQRDEDETEH